MGTVNRSSQDFRSTEAARRIDMTRSEPLKTIYREWAERFEKLLKMPEYPLAVKMAEKDEDIPELAKRPLRDFGYHLNTCQCFAMSRRIGEMIAQKQEDAWCFEPVLAYGFCLAAGVFGPMLAGFIFDNLHSYFIAFLVAAMVYVIAAIFIHVMKAPSHHG